MELKNRTTLMKSTRTIGWLLLMVSGVCPGPSAEAFRPDINPALQYYQAFLVAPDLAPADRDYLFVNNWQGRKLPDRFGRLLAGYDTEFTVLRRAAHATVPCDWGIDFSEGTATLLPQLARTKAAAVTARLRAMWACQQGCPNEACADLLAALALGRNCSRDGTLISVLVQIATEQILCAAVAENFRQFTPETLETLAAGFEAAPARRTIAASMPGEKACFHDALVRRILALQKENPANDAKVMAGIRELLVNAADPDSREPNVWSRLDKAAGGTSAGVLKLLRDMEPLYERLAKLMALPPAQFDDQLAKFSAEVQQSSNFFVSLTFPAVAKSRQKEFAALAALAMVRAAVEFKLHGEAGLKNVSDPCGQGPFACERFVLAGVDRGFALRSAYTGRGYAETLIFVEKDGPPFRVNGIKIGEALPKSSIKE
jgi:hypothetical protein